jgi:hypothetical protein
MGTYGHRLKYQVVFMERNGFNISSTTGSDVGLTNSSKRSKSSNDICKSQIVIKM